MLAPFPRLASTGQGIRTGHGSPVCVRIPVGAHPTGPTLLVGPDTRVQDPVGVALEDRVPAPVVPNEGQRGVYRFVQVDDRPVVDQVVGSVLAQIHCTSCRDPHVVVVLRGQVVVRLQPALAVDLFVVVPASLLENGRHTVLHFVAHAGAGVRRIS